MLFEIGSGLNSGSFLSYVAAQGAATCSLVPIMCLPL